MEYKFDRNDDWFYVFSKEEKLKTLERFTNYGWTSQKIQNLIEEVDRSRDQESENSFDWQNEDVFFRSNKYGVFFVDLMSRRAGQKSEKQDLVLEHDEFIKFLKSFKKFIEENS